MISVMRVGVVLTNIAALEKTLAVLNNLGRIEPIDAARVEALTSMARALDLDPSNAALWGRYLGALRELLEADGDADSGINAALAEIRGAAEVGDSATS